MANNLKGTKTLQNLINSFAGESQARNRYTMYAGVAQKEGYIQIQQVFLSTADNERLHAKEFYKKIADYLGPNVSEKFMVQSEYPVELGDTYHNLLAAAEGEHEEFALAYKEAGDIAEQEGFADIAALFRLIAVVEKEHEDRYRAFAEHVKNGTLYKRETPVQWICSKCGHVHTGLTAPKSCPICRHDQGYFIENVKNY